MFVISIAVGLAMAVAYYFFASRTQLWLTLQKGRLPLWSVLLMLVRLALLGVILFVLAKLTPLNLIAVVIAFAALFTVFNAISLYRFATGRGPLGVRSRPKR